MGITTLIKQVIESSVPLFYGRGAVEFTYPKGLKKIKRVLAILPRDTSSIKEILSFKERLLFAMGKRKVVTLSIGVPLEIVEEWGTEYLYFTDSEVTMDNWVSKRVINEVRKHNFSMCVDFSSQFDVITAQVAIRAQIPLRIGVWHKKDFFNISLIASSEPKQFYEQLAYILENGAWV